MGSSGETLCILDSLVIVLGARPEGDAGGGEIRSTDASENSTEVEKHFARLRWQARTRAVLLRQLTAKTPRHRRCGLSLTVF